ncbi:MAG: CARDB domain-containing protein [Thermoleophilia bacterium]
MQRAPSLPSRCLSGGRSALAVLLALVVALVLAGQAVAEQAGSRVRSVQAGAIDAGSDHTCAILDDGTVRCWGANAKGQLGYGDTAPVGDDETPGSVGPVDLGAGRTATAITAGSEHTCAILDTGAVRCWGDNSVGQLGYGNTDTIGDDETPGSVGPVDLGAGRTATAITAGGLHTCAILDDGAVRCWGNNATGSLGYGDQVDIGDTEAPGSVAPVDLGPGRTAVAIAAGGSQTCAILDDGALLCWGLGQNGRLGYGDEVTIGDGETPASAGPVDVGAGRSAVAIAAGGVFTCALLDDGTVRCWGFAGFGSLGYGDTTTIGDDETPGSVGPLDLGTGRTAVALSAGTLHACATLDDGTVRCWGFGGAGRLGYGSTATIGDGETPAAVGPVGLGTGRTAVAITTGGAHSCATLDDGTVRCWGDGASGHLGYASIATIGDNEPPAAAGPASLGGSLVDAVADLSVTLSTTATAATVGTPFGLSVTVANAGPDAADPELEVALGSQAVSLPLPTLVAGDSYELDTTATPTAAGPMTLLARILTAVPFDPDSTPGNLDPDEDDQSSTTVTVSAAPTPPAPGPAPATPPPVEPPAPPPADSPAPSPAAPLETAGDAPPSTAPATSPPASTRVRPSRLTLTLAPRRDTTAPHRFVVMGRLVAPGITPRACVGRVAVAARAGRRALAARTVHLRRRDGACAYRATLSIAAGTRGTARTARVTARFVGNDALLPVGTRAATVTLA